MAEGETVWTFRAPPDALKSDLAAAKEMLRQFFADAKAMASIPLGGIGLGSTGAPGAPGTSPASIAALPTAAGTAGVPAAAGSANNSISEFSAAVRQFTVAVQSIARGNVAGGAPGTGGSYGGAPGRPGSNPWGRSGHGPGGFGFYRNPFSPVGIARTLGISPGYVYAAEEGLHLAGTAAQSFRDYNNTGRFLREWSTGGLNAFEDPYLQGQATRMAHIRGEETALGGLKSLPGLGRMLGSVEQITGVSEKLSEEKEQIQKSVDAHRRLVRAANEASAGMMEMSGDKLAAQAMRANMRMAEMAQNTTDNPWNRRLMKIVQNEEQSKLVLAESEYEGGIRSGDYRNASIAFRGESEMFGLDPEAAMRARQQARRADYNARYAKFLYGPDAQFADWESPGHQRIREQGQTQFAIEDRNLDLQDKAEAQNEDIRQRVQNEQLRGDKRAAELRTQHESAAAEMEAFKTKATTQLIQAENQPPEIQAKIKAKLQADQDEFIGRQTDEQAMRLGSHYDAYQAAKLQQQLRPFEASQLLFTGAQQRQIKMLPASEQGPAAAALAEEVKAREFLHTRELNNEASKLDAEVKAAKYREQNMGQAGSTAMQIEGILSSARNSPIELRAKANATALEELREMRLDMLGGHGGGEAVIGVGRQVVGDPLGLSGRARSARAQAKDIDDAMKSLQGAPGAGPGGTGPGGIAPGGGGFAPNPFEQNRWVPELQKSNDILGAATGFLKEIKDILKSNTFPTVLG